MKSNNNLLEQLISLSHFNKDTVYHLGVELGLTDATVDTYISRFLKNKEILQLKNGLYVSMEFYKNNRDDISYSFYLSNIIRKPSYISSWTALQYYNLTTESILSITSVTPKVTRNYQTKMGSFSYQSITKKLFTDFKLEKSKFNFFIASPSKALFDLLYFRTNQFRGVNLGKIKELIVELRIDFDEMDKKEQIKFYSMIKEYSNE
ncbi:MAG: hypothetical protein US31_C0010G0019 [Berkelbacteria bacterium GW2011_GWA1_36_9]|uniref:Transcriptional regulator n=1 Tax=Berkelbacteria bacterium GW2011_GWA1_36_9 TaxID=1618331 RepID=A0A0G0FW94_9BACT|nr:MAG: hypothetical protein US31_C0010G0019 [Berkelbacteria bacterium GW2011_GWA1_36_9]